MNLLPSNILHRRKIYAYCSRLAAVQAVIFLLFVLTVWAFNFVIELREARAARISLQIQDERFVKSEEVVQALRNHSAGQAMQEALRLQLPIFDTKRLDMIKDTLPMGTWLTQVDMDEAGAVLTLLTEDLSLIDIHRDAWIATGLASQVQLASIVSAGGGEMQYILTLRWKYD